jgi:hypothetical protein
MRGSMTPAPDHGVNVSAGDKDRIRRMTIVVHSDKEAFEKLLRDLTHDVGTIIKLIGPAGPATGFDPPDAAPYGALIRMLFPFAESVGDLLYRTDNTSLNLKSVLENEFDGVRPGYKGKAASLLQLFRHSFTHTNAARVLLTPSNKRVGWQLTYQGQSSHLTVDRRDPNHPQVCFDTTAFYDDLAEVCRREAATQRHGKAKDRYNSWTELRLDPCKGPQKRAIDEIKNNFQ